MFKHKYRVVTDKYCGYEAQVKRWWFPLWWQIGINTSTTVVGAESHCKHHARLCTTKYGVEVKKVSI